MISVFFIACKVKNFSPFRKIYLVYPPAADVSPVIVDFDIFRFIDNFVVTR